MILKVIFNCAVSASSYNSKQVQFLINIITKLNKPILYVIKTILTLNKAKLL